MMARGVYARRGNAWSTDQLRKLAAMKQQGVVQSLIADEIGKDVQQINNKWSYIQRKGISRALEMAVDPPEARNGHSRLNPVESVLEASEESLSLTDIKLTVNFVKGVGGSERASYLVGTLSSLGAV